MNRTWFGMATLAVFAVACGSGSGSSPEPTEEAVSSAAEASTRQPIALGISMFLLVDDDENPDPDVSTNRDIADLTTILRGVSDIWDAADIRFELRFIGALVLPRDVLVALMAGNTGPFFDGLGTRFDVTSASTVNAFFVPSFDTANGVNPTGTRTAFIVDEPTVHDRRVTSHEIGHMLGLHHELHDPGQLMFSGTNGMRLTEPEIATARYVAAGILSGVR
ncbi:MAG: hypothetical protein O3C10_05300 [Chloroflexi bacterium]|nr:hypothetical protein [Chloroflexota bacterium]